MTYVSPDARPTQPEAQRSEAARPGRPDGTAPEPARGGGAAREAGRGAGSDMRDTASDDARWQAFATALTGKKENERTVQEELLLEDLRAEMLQGEIAPEFVMADGDEIFLPEGTQGAFVPGRRGERGRVLLRRGMTKQERRATAREEQGEAVAARARAMGIGVAEGDAGARAALVFAGRPVSRDTNPGLFRAQDSDTATVRVGEREVTAQARQTEAPHGNRSRFSPAANSFLDRTIALMSPERRAGYPANNSYMDAGSFKLWFGLDQGAVDHLHARYGVTLRNGQKGFSAEGIERMYEDGILTDVKSAPTAPPGTTSMQLVQQGVPPEEADKQVNGVVTVFTPRRASMALSTRAGFRDPQTGGIFFDEASLMSTFGLDKRGAELVLRRYGMTDANGKKIVGRGGVERMFMDKVLVNHNSAPTAPPGTTVADLIAKGYTPTEANQAVWGQTTTLDAKRLLFPNHKGGPIKPEWIVQKAFELSGKPAGARMTAEEARYWTTMVVKTIDPNANVNDIGDFILALTQFGDKTDGTATIGREGLSQAFSQGFLRATSPSTPAQKRNVGNDQRSGVINAGYAFYDLTDDQANPYLELMDVTERAAAGDPAALKRARELYTKLRSSAGPRMAPLFDGLPATGKEMTAADFKNLDTRFKGDFMRGLNARKSSETELARTDLLEADIEMLAREIDTEEFQAVIAQGGASGALDYVGSMYGVEFTHEEKKAFVNGQLPDDPIKRKVMWLAAAKFADVVAGPQIKGDAATKIFQNAMGWDLGMRTSAHGVDAQNEEHVYVGDPNEVASGKDRSSPENDDSTDGRTPGTEAARSFFSVGRQLYAEVYGEEAARLLDEEIHQRDYSTGDHDLIVVEDRTRPKKGRMPARRYQTRRVDEKYYDPNTGLLTGRYAEPDHIPIELNLTVVMTKQTTKKQGLRNNRRSVPILHKEEVQYGDVGRIEELRAQGFKIDHVAQRDATQGQLQMAHFRQAYNHARANYKPVYDAQGNLTNPNPTARFAQYYQQTDFHVRWTGDPGPRGEVTTKLSGMGIRPSGQEAMTDEEALRDMLADLGFTPDQVEELMLEIEKEVERISDLYPDATGGGAVAEGFANALSFGLFGLIKSFSEKYGNHKMTDYADSALKNLGRSTWQSGHRENESDPDIGMAIMTFVVDLAVDTFVDGVTGFAGKGVKLAAKSARAAMKARRAAGAARRARRYVDDAGQATGDATGASTRGKPDKPAGPHGAAGNPTPGGKAPDTPGAQQGADAPAPRAPDPRAPDATPEGIVSNPPPKKPAPKPADDASSTTGQAGDDVAGGSGQPQRGGHHGAAASRAGGRAARSGRPVGGPPPQPTPGGRAADGTRAAASAPGGSKFGARKGSSAAAKSLRNDLADQKIATPAERARVVANINKLKPEEAREFAEVYGDVMRKHGFDFHTNPTAGVPGMWTSGGKPIKPFGVAPDSSDAAKTLKRLGQKESWTEAEWKEIKDALADLEGEEALSVPFELRQKILRHVRKNNLGGSIADDEFWSPLTMNPGGRRNPAEDFWQPMATSDPSSYSWGTAAMRRRSSDMVKTATQTVLAKYGDRLKKWKSLSRADRIELLNDIHKDVGAALGMDPSELPKLKFRRMDGNDLGSYNPTELGGDDTMTLSTDRLLDADDPVMALNTMMHETTHARQYKLIRGLEDGTITAGHPDFEEAQLHWANQKYQTTRSGSGPDTDDPNYRAQVMEQQAYQNGDDMARGVADELGFTHSDDGGAARTRGESGPDRREPGSFQPGGQRAGQQGTRGGGRRGGRGDRDFHGTPHETTGRPSDVPIATADEALEASRTPEGFRALYGADPDANMRRFIGYEPGSHEIRETLDGTVKDWIDWGDGRKTVKGVKPDGTKAEMTIEEWFDEPLKKSGMGTVDRMQAQQLIKEGRYTEAYAMMGDSLTERNLDNFVKAGTLTKEEADGISKLWDTLTVEEKGAVTMYLTGPRIYKRGNKYMFVSLNETLGPNAGGPNGPAGPMMVVLGRGLGKLRKKVPGTGKTMNELFIGKPRPDGKGPVFQPQADGRNPELSRGFTVRSRGDGPGHYGPKYRASKELKAYAALEVGDTVDGQLSSRVSGSFNSSSMSSDSAIPGNVTVKIKGDGPAVTMPFASQPGQYEATLPPGYVWRVTDKNVTYAKNGEVKSVVVEVEAVPGTTARREAAAASASTADDAVDGRPGTRMDTPEQTGVRRRRGGTQQDDEIELVPWGARRSDEAGDAAVSATNVGALGQGGARRGLGRAGVATGAAAAAGGAGGIAYFVSRDGKQQQADLSDPDDFLAYMMSFDGSSGGGADGKLDAREIANAQKAYFGSSEGGLEAPEIAMLTKLYGRNGKVGKEDLRAAMNEGVLGAVQGANGPEFFVDPTAISPTRAQQAIWARVADRRGVDPSEIDTITESEFDEALDFIFEGQDLTAPAVREIAKGFGIGSMDGQRFDFDRSSVRNVFQDGRLEIGGHGELIDDKEQMEVLGDGSPPVDPDPTTPYSPERRDSAAGSELGRRGGPRDGADAAPMAEFGTSSHHIGGKPDSSRVMVPQSVLGGSSGQPGVYDPPQLITQRGNKRTSSGVPRQSMTRVQAEDDPNVVVWSLGGVSKRVAKGSKLDRYLTDYSRATQPKGRQHLAKRPNLERVKSHTDPKTGHTVEIWAPREHQFAKDASGKPIKIESKPVIVVRDKSGRARVVQKAQVFTGTSSTTGNAVMAIRVSNPLSGSGGNSSDPTTTFVMPLDEKAPPRRQRAVLNLISEADRKSRHFEIGEVETTEDDSEIILPDDGSIDAGNPELGRRGDPGGLPLTNDVKGRINNRVNDLMGQAQGAAVKAANADPTQRARMLRTEQNGKWMHIDVAIQLGLARKSDKADPNQYVQIEMDGEVKKRLKAVGLSTDKELVAHEIPAGHGRRLQQNHAGFFALRAQKFDVQNFGADYWTHGTGDGKKRRVRAQAQYLHNSAILPGFAATADAGVRGNGSESRVTAQLKAKSISVFRFRVGYDGPMPNVSGMVPGDGAGARAGRAALGLGSDRYFAFVEGNVGMTWEAGGGYDSARPRNATDPSQGTQSGGFWSPATLKPVEGSAFIGQAEAHVWHYSARDSVFRQTTAPVGGKIVTGGDVRFSVDFSAMQNAGTSIPDFTLSWSPMLIKLRNLGDAEDQDTGSERGAGWRSWARAGGRAFLSGLRNGAAETAWNTVFTAGFGAVAQMVSRQNGVPESALTALGFGTSTLGAGGIVAANPPQSQRPLSNFLGNFFRNLGRRNAGGEPLPAANGQPVAEAVSPGGDAAGDDVVLRLPPGEGADGGDGAGASGDSSAGSGAHSGTGARPGDQPDNWLHNPAFGRGADTSSDGGDSGVADPSGRPAEATVSGRIEVIDTTGDGQADAVAMESGGRSVAVSFEGGEARVVDPSTLEGGTVVDAVEMGAEVEIDPATGQAAVVGGGGGSVHSAGGSSDPLADHGDGDGGDGSGDGDAAGDGGQGEAAAGDGDAEEGDPPKAYTFETKRFTFYKPFEVGYSYQAPRPNNAPPDDITDENDP